MRALLALLVAMLLLGASSGVAGNRADAFPGYKEEEAPACADQMGAAICEDYKVTQGCSRGALRVARLGREPSSRWGADALLGGRLHKPHLRPFPLLAEYVKKACQKTCGAC